MQYNYLIGNSKGFNKVYICEKGAQAKLVYVPDIANQHWHFIDKHDSWTT